jgi:hypothetical protein
LSDGCEDCLSGIFDPDNDGIDYDIDGLCDIGDPDDDDDGYNDDVDACSQGMLNVGTDYDLDGCQDAEDSDEDGDGVLNGADNCIHSVPATQQMTMMVTAVWVVVNGNVLQRPEIAPLVVGLRRMICIMIVLPEIVKMMMMITMVHRTIETLMIIMNLCVHIMMMIIVMTVHLVHMTLVMMVLIKMVMEDAIVLHFNLIIINPVDRLFIMWKIFKIYMDMISHLQTG